MKPVRDYKISRFQTMRTQHQTRQRIRRAFIDGLTIILILLAVLAAHGLMVDATWQTPSAAAPTRWSAPSFRAWSTAAS